MEHLDRGIPGVNLRGRMYRFGWFLQESRVHYRVHIVVERRSRMANVKRWKVFAGMLLAGISVPVAAEELEMGGFQVKIGDDAPVAPFPTAEPDRMDPPHITPTLKVENSSAKEEQMGSEEVSAGFSAASGEEGSMPGETEADLEEREELSGESTLAMEAAPAEEGGQRKVSGEDTQTRVEAVAADLLSGEEGTFSEPDQPKGEEKVKFGRQLRIREGELSPQITVVDRDDWYVYTFQVNQREVYYSWEGDWCTGQKIDWREGENVVDVLVRTGEGDFFFLDSWTVLWG